MKIRPGFLCLTTLFVFLPLEPASATPITTYFISVNTSSISGNDGQLDFQFNPGSGAQGAFIDIGMFGFSEGGPSGSPTLNGGASGSLGGGIHIANTSGLNEYLQNFSFGLSIQFQISFGGPAVSSPDGTSTDTFGLALYDPSFNPQLNDGSLGDFIVTIDVGSDGNTTATTGSSPAGLVTVTPVLTPEPGTWVLCGIGLGLVLRRRKRVPMSGDARTSAYATSARRSR